MDAPHERPLGKTAIRSTHSEGAVHSHTRWAFAAGVGRDEDRHTLLLLLSTIGLPNMVAAMSWADDVIAKKRKK